MNEALEQGAPADVLKRAAEFRRVCRAWHEAREVQVFSPGIRRAEG